MCMDFLDIRHQIEVLNKRVDLYHFDIMDGHYVPNITLSPDLAKVIAKVSDLPLDFHMMCTDPMLFLEPCRKAVEPLTNRGIRSFFSPHCELLSGTGFRAIDAITKAGLRPGVAINPETPLSQIMAYLHRLDKVTFMSVDPGFAGQPFIPEVMEKIREAKAIKEANPEKYHFIIEIDGSCNKKTFGMLADCGVESFIVGTSGLFNNDPDLERAFDIMMEDFNRAVNANG